MIVQVYFNSVLEMTGEGEEILMDRETGEVMAKLFNGNFQTCLAKDPKQADIETLIIKAA